MRLPPPAVLLAVALAGCQKAEPAAPTPAAPAGGSTAPVPVTVGSPKRMPLAWTIDQPATVQAFETTPVVAKLPGYVSTVHVDLGDEVKVGDPLADVSIPELVQEAAQKRAQVAVAAAEFTQAERMVDVAKAQVGAADASVNEAAAGRARAQADYERWESEAKRVTALVGRGVVDSQTQDETSKQFKSAAAAREEVAAKVASAETTVKEAAAKLGRAEADVVAAGAKKALAAADADRVAALLEYTKLRAPFAGVVTARHVHTGHFIQPAAGARLEPLFTVARLDVVRVFAEVPEAVADKAGKGAKAVVRVPALGGREFPASVTRTSRVISPESRTLRVEIDIPNPAGVLRPGMYAVARISAASPDAMVVPAAAVLYADETAYLYAVADGKAAKLRAQVGRTDGGFTEIIGVRKASGPPADFAPLTGNERLAVGNLGPLADGQPVTEAAK